MADLDDFFAKKDRKKAKGKKFTTTDEVAKKLEETGKRVEKTKLKDKPLNQENEEIQHIEDEDEWKEFQEEKKDYSGLKIGNLTVGESTDVESDNEKGTGDNSSDGESGENARRSKAWNKSEPLPPQPGETVEEIPMPAPTPAPAPAPAAHTGSSSYKPPHLRNVSTVSASPKVRAKNVAPDIHSEEYFPTLNSKQPTTESSGAWGRRKKDEGTFEEVRNRGSNKSYSVQESAEPKLSLGNKYSALSQYQS